MTQVSPLDALQAALGLRALRHQAIAGNLANLDTPGYLRRDVDFRRALAAALDRARPQLLRTDPRHLPPTTAAAAPAFVVDPSVMRPDGNGVDVDRELAELARNTLEYGALARILGDELARLSLAVGEGRR